MSEAIGLTAEAARVAQMRRALADELHPGAAFERSESEAVLRLAAEARRLAATGSPSLIAGEPGAGKGALARAIHAWRPNRVGAWIQVCGPAAPPRIEARAGDTLFLDDAGALSAAAQARAADAVDAGALVIATAPAFDDPRLRPALRERLAIGRLWVPPLRERLADLAALSAAYLAQLHRETGRGPWRLSRRSLERLRRHDWPGNLRELVNALERATMRVPAGIVDARVDAADVVVEDAPPPPLCTLASLERDHIRRVLQHTGGKIYGGDGAAAILGLKPSTLQSRMRKLGVDRAST